MLLSNQQKYILEILKEFKYLRVRQLHALVQAHYRTQGIKIDERRMEIMLRQMRTGTNYVWLRGDVVSYGDRRIDPRLTVHRRPAVRPVAASAAFLLPVRIFMLSVPVLPAGCWR